MKQPNLRTQNLCAVPPVPHDASESVQVWGGAEYTCNRVQETYFDQTVLSGHDGRLDDYQRFAELGIRTLRVGLLWERYVEQGSWSSFDEHMSRMRDLGLEPIAGLVHHGSGPRHTSLLDETFPTQLADYAEAVATRYPWITSYTPVNECNTTARFSGMYGVWYPHHMSRESYLRALLNEVKATVLSMRAIRNVNSDAVLIQTEDLGQVSGTELLRSSWELMNERQWLAFDLLCGRVDRQHPMFEYLSSANISDREIAWFQENQCPPGVIGVNYYVTSDRYLDHRTADYPQDRRSAEGPFCDVEAVRVRAGGVRGVSSILKEAWNRYHIPTALTEVHLGCSTDEQIRWLAEAWEGVAEARRAGVQCKAITAWALLGSFYWNQLVTCANGHYEPGCFDIRGGRPERTELADIVEQIASGRRPQHPALSHRGWWRHESRIIYSGGEEHIRDLSFAA